MYKTIKDHPYIFSFASIAVLMIAVFLLYGVVFDTVDDYNVMMTLAGEKTGRPYYELTFYSVCLAFVISLFYQATDAVQWYSLFEIAMVYTSISLILARITIASRKHAVPGAVFGVLAFVFLVIFFLYPVQRLQFSSTAALLGAAACAIICTCDFSPSKRKQLAKDLALSVVFLVLCFAERLSAGYCLLAFWLVLLFFSFLRANRIDNSKQVRTRIACAALSAIVCCGAIFSIDYTVRHVGDNANYMEYNQYRADFQDYPHPTYKDGEELYASVGWSEEIYRLASSLSYLDDSINEENLKKIVESEEYAQIQPGIGAALKLAVKQITSNDAAKAIVIALGGMFLCFLIQVISLRKQHAQNVRFRLARMATFLILAIALVFYLCLEGRFPLRSLQCITFPLGVIMLFELVSLNTTQARLTPPPLNTENAVETICHPGASMQLACMMLLLAFGASFYLSQGYVKELHVKRDAASIQNMQSVESYASRNPDKVFVHDFSITGGSNAYDPFRTHPGKLTNLIISGGSYTHTGAYNDQLQQNGLEELTGKTLLEEDVYYISKKSSKQMKYLLDYMESQFGPVEAKKIEDLSKTTAVYKIALAPENELAQMSEEPTKQMPEEE